MLKIRYSRAYALFFLGLGIFELWIMLSTRQWIIAPLAVITLIFGVRASSQVYLTVEPTEVIIHAIVGPLKRHYPYQSANDVSVMDGRLLIDSNGKRRQISLPIWMLNREDIAAVRERFR